MNRRSFLALIAATEELQRNLDSLRNLYQDCASSNAAAIFKQMTTIATTVFVVPDGFVINPANWQTVQLSKVPPLFKGLTVSDLLK